MKMIKNIFDKLRPSFETGGKMSKMKPLFEAMDNFFFSPDSRTLSAPHIRDPLDLKRYMSMVIIGLLPALMVSFYNYGPLTILPMIIVSYAAGGAVEVIFAVVRKEEIQRRIPRYRPVVPHDPAAYYPALDAGRRGRLRRYRRQGSIRRHRA